MPPEISFSAVAAAAFVQFALGGIWYGPLLGRQWSQLTGVPENTGSPQPLVLIAMIGCALVMAFVLAHVLVFGSAYMGIGGLRAGLLAGFWMWLGFAAPITLGAVLSQGKPLNLWAINAGYYLVSLMSMGALLAMWR